MSADPIEGWRAHAACVWPPGEIGDEFVGLDERTQSPALRRALRICVGCPVRRECLMEALEWEEYDSLWSATRRGIDIEGVWGGTLKRERVATRHDVDCSNRTQHRTCRTPTERADELEQAKKDYAHARDVYRKLIGECEAD